MDFAKEPRKSRNEGYKISTMRMVLLCFSDLVAPGELRCSDVHDCAGAYAVYVDDKGRAWTIDGDTVHEARYCSLW